MSLDRNVKIYVAGHRGMIGSAVVRRLEAGGCRNIVNRPRVELGLIFQMSVLDFIASRKPGLHDVVRSVCAYFPVAVGSGDVSLWPTSTEQLNHQALRARGESIG